MYVCIRVTFTTRSGLRAGAGKVLSGSFRQHIALLLANLCQQTLTHLTCALTLSVTLQVRVYRSAEGVGGCSSATPTYTRGVGSSDDTDRGQ